MRTRFLRGTRDQNNGLTLAEGELTIDEETRALRLHDGTTPGGFELLGTRAVEGPTQGDLTAGFYGEIPSTEFITYADLATEIGLSAGTSINNEAPWLKFALDGKLLYYPKLAVRYGLSWLDIDTVGAVDGTLTLPINGKNYIVRLMKTGTTDPIDFVSNTYADPIESHGSEWNRLMYRVCDVDPSSQNGDNWAVYTVDDLGLNGGFGYRTHMQETLMSDPTYTFNRGYHSGYAIDGFSPYVNTIKTNVYGWRPVLELVQ